ncbi:hypothetical protein SDC9_198393 [bioreactor metagenome]|uniref:Uncharacterized protein n=1 Tax=bioreactor metagenome TaxID=1076179 RepID=A0A645II20_9ZZZZ
MVFPHHMAPEVFQYINRCVYIRKIGTIMYDAFSLDQYRCGQYRQDTVFCASYAEGTLQTFPSGNQNFLLHCYPKPPFALPYILCKKEVLGVYLHDLRVSMITS